jgi:hypothetical protein
MNFAQARYQVQLGLDDVNAQYWSVAEINLWINEGAKLMNSRAQCLTNVWQLPANSAQVQQEYLLPEDMDEVLSVRFFQGTLLVLKPKPQKDLQFGTRLVGTPMHYYIRYGTLTYAGQGPSGDVLVQPITTNLSKKPKFIIGLSPIPQNPNNITVLYNARHPMLMNDEDELCIPDEFERGVIAYAIAQGKNKEEAYAEADKWMSLFTQFTESCKEKFDNMGQEDSLPTFKIRNTADNEMGLGGSSWIYVGDASYG